MYIITRGKFVERMNGPALLATTFDLKVHTGGRTLAKQWKSKLRRKGIHKISSTDQGHF